MSCSLCSENGGHFKPKYGGHFDRFFQLNTFDVNKKIEHLQQYPNLIKELNDTILSSFIGISRETFARNKKFLSEY